MHILYNFLEQYFKQYFKQSYYTLLCFITCNMSLVLEINYLILSYLIPLTQLILLRNIPCVEQSSLLEVIGIKQSVDRIK